MKSDVETPSKSDANASPGGTDPCPDVIDAIVGRNPAVVGVEVGPDAASVSLSYDRTRLTGEEAQLLADQVGQALEPRFPRCTLYMQPVGGRACETCALRLEKRLEHLPGVRKSAASFRTGVLSISYDDAQVTPDEIVAQVSNFGVHVSQTLPAALPEMSEKPWYRRLASLPGWINRDRLAAAFTLLTFITMIAGLLAERFGAPAAVIYYGLAYLFGGVFGVRAGFQALRHLTIDVDLLMILAAIGAWIIGAPFEGALLLFLFSLSNVLQTYALGRTRNAIRSIMKLRPKEALTRRNGVTALVPIDSLRLGDRVVIRPGERIPVDGVVLEGESAVDQSSITGESMPVQKTTGSRVLSGTVNQSGGLEVSVDKLAQDSTIAKMIRMVEEAQSERAQTQRFIDRFEQYYAMGVIAFTALLVLVPVYLLENPFEPAFYRAMTAMVAASPCALVISTPASILSAIGNGARKGILFKGGVHVEKAAEIKVIAFDKTGTLTEGRPFVTDLLVLKPRDGGPGHTQEALLRLAAAVEARSEHPLGKAIVAAATRRGLDIPDVNQFQSDTGRGVQGELEGGMVLVGSRRFIAQEASVDLSDVEAPYRQLQEEGKTAMIVAQVGGGEGRVVGLIGVADVLRANAAQAVAEIRAQGVDRVVMLTGDSETVAQAIAREAGLDRAYAGLLPEDKLRIVRQIREEFGPVAMVGDGVNDAPALAAADLGIAMGAAGTDVALETADIVLMSDDLTNLAYLIALSHRTRRTLVANLGFSLFMIALMLMAIFAVDFSLPMAVVGHEGGTVLVSLNGLRLLFFKKPA